MPIGVVMLPSMGLGGMPLAPIVRRDADTAARVASRRRCAARHPSWRRTARADNGNHLGGVADRAGEPRRVTPPLTRRGQRAPSRADRCRAHQNQQIGARR